MSEWHVPDELAARFAGDARQLDPVTAASVEQHVVACGRCQQAVALHGVDLDLEAVWADVLDEIDRPRSAIGVVGAHRWVRLLAATGPLRLSSTLALSVIVALVVLIARASDRPDVFLVIAPLLPVALVALSFAPRAEPAGECARATPAHGMTLLMWRVSALIVVASMALVVGSRFLSLSAGASMKWLLPALALSLCTLAGGLRWPARNVAVLAAVLWMAGVVIALRASHGASLVDTALFGGSGQAAAGVVAVVAAVWLVAWRDSWPGATVR